VPIRKDGWKALGWSKASIAEVVPESNNVWKVYINVDNGFLTGMLNKRKISGKLRTDRRTEFITWMSAQAWNLEYGDHGYASREYSEGTKNIRNKTDMNEDYHVILMGWIVARLGVGDIPEDDE